MRSAGIYSDVDIEEYHSEEGISSSGISLIMDCPRRYWWEYMAERKKEPKNNSFVLGSALHTAILEPNEFLNRFYLMNDSVDLRTKAGKEAMAVAELNAAGKTIIREQECEILMNMELAVQSHSLWKKIDVHAGHVENSIYWDSILNVRLRARPDFFNDNIIIDLKTTDSIASFAKSVYNYGYHRQAAMQLDGLKTIDGRERFFTFFVVEKRPPYLTACFVLDEEAIEQGRKEYLDGAVIYKMCLDKDEWPGYEEKFQLLSLPKWAVRKDDEEI